MSGSIRPLPSLPSCNGGVGLDLGLVHESTGKADDRIRTWGGRRKLSGRAYRMPLKAVAKLAGALYFFRRQPWHCKATHSDAAHSSGPCTNPFTS
jgi:hypothetical protein